jgi:hypothetical protein
MTMRRDNYAYRNPGLELRFIEAVEQAIRRVLEAPERWRVLDGDVRRCLTRVFPYAILYTIEPDYILIDCRRDAWTPGARLLALSD